MGEEKNLSETDLISRESGAQFESLPEMTLTTRLILGECQMEIAEILKLGQGSVLELDSMTGQPLELWVNDQFIAKLQSENIGPKSRTRVHRGNYCITSVFF